MSVRFGNTWGLTVQRGPWKPNSYDAGFTVTGQKHAGHGDWYSAERPNTNPTTPYSIPTVKSKSVKYADGNFMPSTRPGRVQRSYNTHGRKRMAPRQVGLNTTMEDAGTQTADFLGGGMSGSPAPPNGSTGSSNGGLNDTTLFYPSNSEVISPIPIVPGDPAFDTSAGEVAIMENSFNSSTPRPSPDFGPIVGMGLSVVTSMVNTIEGGLFEDPSEPDDDPVDQMWMNGESQPYLALVTDMVGYYPHSVAAIDQMGGVELGDGTQLDAEEAQMLATVIEFYMSYGGNRFPQETIQYVNRQLNDGGMDWVESMLEEFAATTPGGQPETPGGGLTRSADINAPTATPEGVAEITAAGETPGVVDEEYPSGTDIPPPDPSTGWPQGLTTQRETKDGTTVQDTTLLDQFKATITFGVKIGSLPDTHARWLRKYKPEQFAEFKKNGGKGIFMETDQENEKRVNDESAMAEIEKAKNTGANAPLPRLVNVNGERFPEGWGTDQFTVACNSGAIIPTTVIQWMRAYYDKKGHDEEFDRLIDTWQNKRAGLAVDEVPADEATALKNAPIAGSNTTSVNKPDPAADDAEEIDKLANLYP